MSVLLKNAPVYYALCQVRFNPVAAMAKFSSEIQDRMRRIGYTVFENDETQTVEFNEEQLQNGTPTLTTTQTWYFTKSDRSCGFVLGHNFLTFQSTNYSDREKFFEALCVGLNIVHEIVQLESVVRIGIRYLNAVIPEAGESINLYLNTQVQTIDFGLSATGGMWQAVYKASQGVLIAKVYHAPNLPLGFPMDLIPRSLHLLKRFQITQPVTHAVIDMDLYVEEVVDIDTRVIYEKLLGFHKDLAACFHAIATDYAFDKWS